MVVNDAPAAAPPCQPQPVVAGCALGNNCSVSKLPFTTLKDEKLLPSTTVTILVKVTVFPERSVKV